ncbi:nucleoside diphosphate kinase 6 [Lasius niger]|uniref:Nucleoside diphosphate kinase 6 n=1 Tax=Lasius niger TaxID=67767 RepID=A0A0J7JZN5_LASNI|nr:nucleoside diphosphate kinase 6 [Lasius niger]
MNLKLVVTETGSPVIENNKLVVWDVDGETPVSETELLSSEQPAVNSKNKNLQSRQLTDISGKKASKLKKENSLWDYIGQQCEDKFKDLRKHYVKARNQNEKGSGPPVVTCKFYNEMDEALDDKPAVKPVSIASTLKKRNQLCT